MSRHKAGPRFSRYAVTGVWNTAFGYGVFALMVARLSGQMHYLLIAALSSVLAISNAYLVHKTFVFLTRGHYLREYSRYWLVYGATGVLGLGLLAVMVSGLRVNVYLAQAGVVALQALLSFAGHRRFSFGGLTVPDAPDGVARRQV